MTINVVLRALRLGDLLTAVPALRALRRAFPDDRLILAAPDGLEPLARLTGAVDDVLPTAGLSQFLSDLHRHNVIGRAAQDQQRRHGPPVRHDQQRYQHQFDDQHEHERSWRDLGRLLDQEPIRAVNLHDRGPLSIDCLQAMRPDQLISYSHPQRPVAGGPPWDDRMHEIERWCSLLEAYDIPADPTDLRLQSPGGPGPCPGAAVIHPGAAYRSRRWPPGRFADVARKLAAEGHQVVITGIVQERKLCRWTAERAGLPESAVLAGRTGLTEFATVIANAGLVVCGDTGTGQLATALNTRSVLLFGPTAPSGWGPTIAPDRHAVLWAGHIGDPYGTSPDPGLLQLQVDQVLDQAHRVLHAA
jgi:ADP-heptose:LPS heptosyltransferase